MQNDPGNQPFIPPPPPSYGNPNFPPDVLAAKATAAAKDARDALIMSLVGIACFGLILGIIAYRKANSALEAINTYGVAQDKRNIAVVAKVIGIIDIVLWAAGLIARFTVMR